MPTPLGQLGIGTGSDTSIPTNNSHQASLGKMVKHIQFIQDFSVSPYVNTGQHILPFSLYIILYIVYNVYTIYIFFYIFYRYQDKMNINQVSS